jgi:hypothetical protein
MDVTQAPPGGARTSRGQIDTDHIGNMGRYLYQIRNMLVFFVILAVLAIAGGVVAAAVIASHGGHQAATCQSLGGSDPSC